MHYQVKAKRHALQWIDGLDKIGSHGVGDGDLGVKLGEEETVGRRGVLQPDVQELKLVQQPASLKRRKEIQEAWPDPAEDTQEAPQDPAEKTLEVWLNRKEETREESPDLEEETRAVQLDSKEKTREVALDSEEGTREVPLDPKEETREVH